MNIFKTIFNSFFSTLGRILLYILLAFLISYLLKDIKLPKLSISNLLFTNVYADSINIRDTADGYVVVNNNSNEYQTYIINPNSTATHRIIMATALSQSDIYSYMFFDVCSTRDIDAIRASSPGQSCENSCWSNQVNTEKTNFNCTTNAQAGKIYRITTPIQKWKRDENDLMASVDDRITIRNLTTDIISTTLYGFYVSDDPNVAAFNTDYTNIINDIGNRQITAIDAATSAINNSTEENRQNTQDIINNQNTNTQSVIDTITDDTEPDADISSLGNVQGLLPAGPVDSLLNIPFMFLSVITTSFGGVCRPIRGTFVFDSTLEIPCFSDLFYNNVPDLVMTFINLIPSAFILILYFKHLYKKVDRAISMNTNADDEWGVI